MKSVITSIFLLISTHLLSAIPVLRDIKERQIIYRGVNARVKNIFDVNFDDGRDPLEPIPAFTKEDAKEISKLGLNMIRLPINWSGIQPYPEKFDDGYIGKILSFLDLCQTYEIDVIIDMHQDAYSKEIGEDGAPPWAILPHGFTPSLGGELGNLILKRISKQTQYAFSSFWKNKKVNGVGLQDHYINSLLFLLNRVAKHKAFAGIEIFNEPWLLNIKKFLPANDPFSKDIHIEQLWSFYTKAINKIRIAHPEVWIYLEPDVSKSVVIPFLNDKKFQFQAVGLPKNPPWKTYKTVYAPHLYTLGMVIGNLFGIDWLNPMDKGIQKSIEFSIEEARQINAELFIGEFGFTHRSKNYEKTLHRIYDFADSNLFHTAQWVWKEPNQDSWGFWDFKEGQGYVLRKKAALDSARAYPSRISGTLNSYQLKRKTKTLSIQLKEVSLKEKHEIVWPTQYGYKATPQVLCGDQEVKWEKRFSKLVFYCDNKVIKIL